MSLYPSTSSLSPRYILGAVSWPLLESFCAPNGIQLCIYKDDILLIFPDNTDLNID
jgi:hypothetical protein